MEHTGPSALLSEHEQLLDQLDYARTRKGRVGDAASALASALSLHMQHEESVFVVLSFAEDLVSGGWPRDAGALVENANRVERDLKKMQQEHDLIQTLSRYLRNAAEDEGEEEVVRFCEQLARHAALEEQVLYPLAVIAGRYLELRGRSQPAAPARPA